MRFLLIALTGLLFFHGLQAQEYIPLWPEGKMPNSKGLNLKDSVSDERIYQVSLPGMFAFFPSKEENKNCAVVIFPPGGYVKLAYNIAGFQLAKWFNTIGVAAFVVNYRLPNSPDLIEREKGPLQDAQRALRIIRTHSGEWNLDPEKIGVMGASAGGHLASTIGTHREDVSAIGDSLDRASYTPDFMILVSPVINMNKYTHRGSRDALLGDNPDQSLVMKYSNESNVNPTSPPAFIVHAANDKVVDPMNSLLFYEALLAHNISASLHIFPRGEHAIALRNNPGSTNLWTLLCEAWLKEMSFVGD